MGIVFAGGMSFVGRSESKILSIAAGVVIIFLGLNVLFDFIRVLGTDSRLIQRYAGKERGQVNAFLMGLAFAAGWSPCIGPILASILMMAARNANIAYAALLLVAYSVGFGIPFIASALFFEKLSPLLRFFKQHGNGVRIFSGILLIGFGVAMVLGSVSRISSSAAQLGITLLSITTTSPSLSKIIGIGIWFLLALVPLRALLRMHKTAQDKGICSHRSNLIVASLFLGFFVVLACLELGQKIKVLEILGKWLTFSGI
jgi:cytochrome c-type biogenesis protein